MTRNTVRNYLVLSCLAFLTLLHILWPVDAAPPRVLAPTEITWQGPAFDPKVLDTFVSRSIGPADMTGRIVQIQAVDGDPKTMYVASASGGLWKTTDGGENFKPVFDHQSSICIGDVAISKSNPNIIWVGTGEHNARNSVAWGDGVYKSTDGGKTWTHMGLKDSHSVGRIAIHPTNPDIVYIGVLGHIWGPNKERGVYKTSDGGKTWELSKFFDDTTGVVDMKMDPVDPNILYVCAYSCQRDAFSGGNPVKVLGPNAGLYKTTDGGKTWSRMTEGLPNSQLGRCGIDIYRKDSNIVYAVVQTSQTPSGNSNEGGNANGGGGPSVGGIFRSEDKGKTWKHMNTLCPRPFYYGQIRVDPNDDKRIYVLGTSTAASNDGGKTFGKAKGKLPNIVEPDDGTGFSPVALQKGGKGGGTIHADHHALWINPKNSNEVWLGTDGGFGPSYDRGKGFKAIRAIAVGQFYGISVDMSKPYYVYGGLQDNGSHGGPSATYDSQGIRQNTWFTIGGGDGFHTANDPTDPGIVYTESQYGAFSRVSVATKGGKKGKVDVFSPDDPGPGGAGGGNIDGLFPVALQKGGKGVKQQGVRFNWSTPMLLSHHDSKTIYYGGAHLLVSKERGANFAKMSPDLTYGEGKGKLSNWSHTLFTIGESPKKKGIVWTGADDGRIMVTVDGGTKWTECRLPGIPKDGCVSRVEPSAHDEGTCYVSFTRYRNDDRKPYIFKTTDFGKTWTNITSNLPENGSVHVVIESSKNKNLLFCGTEFAMFMTMDGGAKWHRFNAGLPTVAVHDLVIHPRDRDLVIATHGRSLYVVDDISPLENFTPEVAAKPAHLFAVRPAVAFKMKSTAAPKSNEFVGKNPPYGSIIRYYLKEAAAQPVAIGILDNSGKQLASLQGPSAAGIQQVVWDLRAGGQKDTTVAPGEYTAVLEIGGQKHLQKVRVDAQK